MWGRLLNRSIMRSTLRDIGNDSLEPQNILPSRFRVLGHFVCLLGGSRSGFYITGFGLSCYGRKQGRNLGLLMISDVLCSAACEVLGMRPQRVHSLSTVCKQREGLSAFSHV